MQALAIDSDCLSVCAWLAHCFRPEQFVHLTGQLEGGQGGHSAVLSMVDGKLSLSTPDRKKPLVVTVDFVSGKNIYRLKNKSINNELIAKAVGLKPKKDGVTKILDVTAGFGRDALLLASFGCEVLMLERSNLVYALLRDGLGRAEKADETREIIKRTRLLHADGRSYIKTRDFSRGDNKDSSFSPDVIYLDPMFPESTKNAAVKKEMTALRYALGADSDSEELLDLALKSGVKRIVVKRPRKGKALSCLKPHFQVIGKSARFDVYIP